MIKKILFLSFIACFIAVFHTHQASALTKGFDAQHFHPAVDDGPYFTVYGSEALGQWRWVIGTTGTYGYHPYQWVEPPPSWKRIRGIVDHQLTQDVYGSIGLVGRWLQVGVDVPVNWLVNWIDPNVAGSTSKNKLALGDVQLNLKSELLDVTKYKVGVAILPFINLPTGSGKYYTGNGAVTGGGKVIFDFLPLERWKIALNFGAMIRPYYLLNNIEQTHRFLYGLGTSIDATKKLSIVGELTGRSNFSNFWQSKGESPLELDAGVKYAIGDSGVNVEGGGGYGIFHGGGVPLFRGFLGVAYHGKVKAKPAEKPKPKFIKLKEQVHFKTDKSNILPKSFPTLNEVVTVLNAHPEIKKLQIEGHTDSRATDAYNQKLSERRAKSVYDYLVKKGISADRLTWVGYGETRPIATNDTVEGRAMNRRTVLRILEVDYSGLPEGWEKEESLRYEPGDTDMNREEALYPDS